MKVELSIKKSELPDTSENREWLKTCEDIINDELNKNPSVRIEFSRIGNEIWFTRYSPKH